jgi:predicted site-specific integrase-resolvase
MVTTIERGAILRLPDDALVTSVEAATMLGMATRSLEAWRRDRKIAYVRLGRTAVRYRVGDVKALIEARTVGREDAV